MANDNNKETRVGRFKKSLGRITEQSTEAVAKAAKQADKAVTRGAKRTGVSDQLDTARERVKRSAEAVTTTAEQANNSSYGLSPREWGNLARYNGIVTTSRSIPA